MGDSQFQTNRELIRRLVDGQDKILEQQRLTNIELIKHSLNIESLNTDNKTNKEFIEAQKKINWTLGGMITTIGALIGLTK